MADAVPERGRNVWGVVYEIDDLEVGTLDASEGYRPGRQKNSYWRRECVVLQVSNEGRPLTVCSYFGDPQPNPPLPNAEYKQLIVSGASHWHLPEDYVRELEAIEVGN